MIKSESGYPVDITGYSFTMSVNTLEAPPNIGTQLFSLAGVITSASGGLVEFAPSALQADQTPGTYYYDIQMTDAGGRIQTLCVGTYTFTQDITK